MRCVLTNSRRSDGSMSRSVGRGNGSSERGSRAISGSSIQVVVGGSERVSGWSMVQVCPARRVAQPGRRTPGRPEEQMIER